VKATKQPKTRVQAIWTLADLDNLDDKSLLAGLQDPDARVRESVTPAAWPLAQQSQVVMDALVKMAEDADLHVRFQVALALGDCDGERAGLALARLIRRDANDPWMRAAIVTSAVRHVDTLLLSVLREHTPVEGSSISPMLGPLFNLAISRSNRAPIALITQTIAEPAGQGGRYASWQFSMLASLLDARDRAGRAHDLDLDKPFALVWTAARSATDDDGAPESERIGAVQLVGYAGRRNAKDRDRLLALLRPKVSIGLQQAAVASLGKGNDPKLADVLLVGWKSYSPSLRTAILDVLLSRSEWTSSLLSSLEDGCVPPAEIDPARRQQLLTRRNARVKSRAEAVFAHQNTPRQSVVDAYRGALKLPGDRTAGAAVFKKACATCHRLGNEGIEVGPNLAAINDKSPEALLIAILDPNRALETRYANFSIATVDGRVLNGLIASETATAVTLRRQEGKEDIVLRSQIEEMTASGQSLMPEGVEKDLKPQDLADLIAFLVATGPAPKAE